MCRTISKVAFTAAGFLGGKDCCISWKTKDIFTKDCNRNPPLCFYNSCVTYLLRHAVLKCVTVPNFLSCIHFIYTVYTWKLWGHCIYKQFPVSDIFFSPLFCMMSERNTIPDMVISGTGLWLNIHLLFKLVFENVGLNGEEIKWLVSESRCTKSSVWDKWRLSWSVRVQ